ncbi:helix-turn-helix domain-containing protein [Simplicispira piscis]
MTDATETDHISSRVRVLEAVRDLYDQEIPVTTASLMRATGLKPVTVTDCIKDLKDRGEIWSPSRGVCLPTVKHPPARAVSRTSLPDGTVKLEVGDDILTLTPRESRMVGEVMGGSAAMLVAIESSNQMSEVLGLVRRIVASDEGRAVR